jgi:hypothetical protein
VSWPEAIRKLIELRAFGRCLVAIAENYRIVAVEEPIRWIQS